MSRTLTQEDLVAKAGPLTQEELEGINRDRRAANYLSVGQIYLRNNPLLREPLRLEHAKPGRPGIGAPHPDSTLFMRTARPTEPRQSP